jgi:uncharacterized protein YwgA
MKSIRRGSEKVVEIIRDAGGEIVGRTKLQKIAYFLELTGLGGGFDFEYRHYGPYSESLTDAVRVANAFGLVEEEERVAKWGGRYSIYKVTMQPTQETDKVRARFFKAAAAISSVELELAATAAYLSAVEDCKEPWQETERRKPEKAAEGRLEKAMAAYRTLQELETPRRLPKIA